MTYENFLKLTLGLQKASRQLEGLHELGVDLVNFTDPYNTIIHDLLGEIWTPEGVDWLEWFMWESDFGTKDFSQVPSYKNVDGEWVKVEGNRWGAHDENGNPICYSYESTWQFLKQYEIAKSVE
jgi:hypothetical protein